MKIMNDERRDHERFNNERLILKVTRPGISGFLRLNPNADCLDYSRSGLQFASDQPMKAGQSLILDFCVHDLELTEIHANVVECIQEDDQTWCCRVKFSKSSKRMRSSEIKRTLLMIEDKLRSHHLYSEGAN